MDKTTYCVLLYCCGEGCDYTIGCNKTWQIIQCIPENLKKNVKQIVADHGWSRIATVEVIEISKKFDLTDIIDEFREDPKIEEDK